MESWRGTILREQSEPHSNDWISNTTVGKFLEALKEDNNDVLNSKVIQKGLNAAMKKYGNEIAELEGEDKKKLNTLISKVLSQGTIDKLADAAAELSTSAATAKAVAVGGAAIAAGAPVAVVGIGSAIFIWAAKEVTKAVAGKGVKMAMDIGGALEDLDIPDQDLGAEPALNLIDISDDYKKVIVGTDGEIDKKEAAALAIGFKSVATAFNKIQEKLAAIDTMPSGNLQEYTAQSTALRELLDEPMTAYMSDTATEAARKAYGKMLSLQRNVTINQN